MKNTKSYLIISAPKNNLNTHTFVGNYIKLLAKHCHSDAYGEYSTVDQAKTACDSDYNCIGFYDAACNGKPQIALCPKGSDFEESQVSCIYQKGMHTYALINKCANIYFITPVYPSN